jgi:hypothetical protein
VAILPVLMKVALLTLPSPARTLLLARTEGAREKAAPALPATAAWIQTLQNASRQLLAACVGGVPSSLSSVSRRVRFLLEHWLEKGASKRFIQRTKAGFYPAKAFSTSPRSSGSAEVRFSL